MGQYHVLVNFDKKEIIHPHTLGQGLKLWEQMWGPPGVPFALHILLACSNGRGGGDFHVDSPLIGSWAGDRIAVVGDYAEDSDIKRWHIRAKAAYTNASEAHEAHGELTKKGWRDISWDMATLMEQLFEGKFKIHDYAKDREDGWMSWMDWVPKQPRAYTELEKWVNKNKDKPEAKEIAALMNKWDW